jgi:excisionase family DNA binding protein
MPSAPTHKLDFMSEMSLMPPADSEFVTVREVAAELRCSPHTVRRRIHAGEIPAVQLGGPRTGLRVPRAALQAWLYSGGTNADR